MTDNFIFSFLDKPKTFDVKLSRNSTTKKPIKLSNVNVIGHYSYDKDCQFKDDSSEILFYKPLPDDAVRHLVEFDLSKGLDDFNKKEESDDSLVVSEMRNFLKWIVIHANENRGDPEHEKRLDTDFVLMRSTLKDLLNVAPAWQKSSGWIICAAKFLGNIYLYGFDTDEKKEYRLRKYDDKTFMWRLKFKNYILSKEFGEEPDPERPVYEAEEFSCVFKCDFGDHKLLYRADVDGVVAEEELTDPIDWEKVKFVDLRTNYQSPYKQKSFLPRAMVNWWSHNCMINTDHILVGFRNREGIVHELKKYELDETTKIAEQFFNPEVSFDFMNKFFGFVKEKVTRDYDQCIYKFEWNPTARSYGACGPEVTIKYEEMDANSDYAFLQDWFVIEPQHKEY